MPRNGALLLLTRKEGMLHAVLNTHGIDPDRMRPDGLYGVCTFTCYFPLSDDDQLMSVITWKPLQKIGSDMGAFLIAAQPHMEMLSYEIDGQRVELAVMLLRDGFQQHLQLHSGSCGLRYPTPADTIHVVSMLDSINRAVNLNECHMRAEEADVLRRVFAAFANRQP